MKERDRSSTITAKPKVERPILSFTPPLVQRACACGSGAPSGVDDHCDECRSKPVMRKARDGERDRAPPAGDPTERLGSGSPLDGATRGRMERGFGFDFSRVRIHADPSADTVASDLGARAFAYGEDVAFAAGQYRPGTPVGDALLAHELAHVVQQSGGTGGAQASAPALEREADRAAFDVAAGLHAPPAQPRKPAVGRGAGPSLQRCERDYDPNPADERASTHLPDARNQCEMLAKLGKMPSPPPAACVAPAAAPAGGGQQQLSQEVRDLAQTWDGLSTQPDFAARRAELKTELFGALDDWLKEKKADIDKLAGFDASRQPIATFEGACKAAELVVRRRFGPWIQNSVRTPRDSADIKSFLPDAKTFRTKATGTPGVTPSDQNLFDSGDPTALTNAGVSISADDRAQRILLMYSARAQAAARAHHFVPTQAGEPTAFLASVIAEWLAAHPTAGPRLELFSRLSIARQPSVGVMLQTYPGANDDLNRLIRRWNNFKTCVHEYLHLATHPRFMQAMGRSPVAFEGFTEMFTREVLEPMLPDDVPDDVRALVEGGAPRPLFNGAPATDAIVIGSYKSPKDYVASANAAEAIKKRLTGPSHKIGRCTHQKDAGGNDAVKAAYFQGHVELLGLDPTGAAAGPTRGFPDEVAVPEGVTTIAGLSIASGVPPDEIKRSNPGLSDGAFPPTVRLPGCREHVVLSYTSSLAPETATESRGDIARMNGVREADLDRANPGVTARGGWATLTAGMFILIPRH